MCIVYLFYRKTHTRLRLRLRMSFFSSMFGGAGGNNAEPPASVLAEWNKYSQATHGTSGSVAADLEAGTASLLRSVSSVSDTASSLVGGFASSSFNKIQTGVTGVGNTVSSTASNLGMPSRQQMLTFGVLMAAALFFLTLAFTVALPVLVIAPAKFAFCFTLGSGCFMAAFGALRGFKAQLEHMTQGDRLPFTACYVGSMLATLYAALFMHSYVFCIIFSAAQLVALLYYSFSYLPGGTAGAKLITQFVGNALSSCFGSAARSILPK